MTRLNTNFNQQAAWETLLEGVRSRVEVDLHEVERVIELARRTPGLSQYEDELRRVSVFFQEATQYHQQKNPDGLTRLVELWERYRATVVQRFAAVTPVELRAADHVVREIFRRFLDGVPNENIAYSKEAVPLVYGGEGGPGSYSTHPPGLNRPFAIINLPHTAFDNVWQWLALPHETGHDTYVTVDGLADEVESALEAAMRAAVNANELTIPAVNVDLNAYRVNHRIQYSGQDFLATVWRNWADEAQADMVGLLSCGGAAAVALQQIIGFRADDLWELNRGPKVHPIPYVRNALNISALRLLGHNNLAQEIDTRFQALRPNATHVRWLLPPPFPRKKVAAVRVDQMVKSAEIAANVLISTPFPSLGERSYRDLGEFTLADQGIVDDMVDRLIKGKPTFAQAPGATPRHALAATMFAFEKNRLKADTINRTFKHFVHP